MRSPSAINSKSISSSNSPLVAAFLLAVDIIKDRFRNPVNNHCFA